MHGPAVRLLQDELAHLRYEVPVSGYFDEATGRAVLAFRKVTGLERIESANAGVFQRCRAERDASSVRYPGDGNHVEADCPSRCSSRWNAVDVSGASTR